MPIRKEFRKFYGREWMNEIRPHILKRDKHRCKKCLKPNHVPLFVISSGGIQYWKKVKGGHIWRNSFGEIEPRFRAPENAARRIFNRLTVAHLDHNPENNADENLAALCCWCHLNHDLGHHAETRSIRKDQARPILVMLGAA